MKLDFTDIDHGKLDALIDGILEAYNNGIVSKVQARAVIAQVFCAAAVTDQARLVREWLEPQRLAQWLEDCRAKRS